ncbi:SseB family protein [Georgenia wangjunii]|uniref:SseB family protein n=1 Tax=Georgenia wangjunii TaxID=3117730 RepID=UPI002F2685FA
MSVPPMMRQEELVTSLARWMMRTVQTQPGWDQLHLELRPLRDRVRIRITEVRGKGSQSRTGELDPERDAYRDARELQEIGARPGAGTWISATIVATATGWPEPRIAVAATLNPDKEPDSWGPADASLDAEDLVHLLTRHPRRRELVPEWVAQRITAAGLSVPLAEGETPQAGPTPPTGTTQPDDDARPTDVGHHDNEDGNVSDLTGNSPTERIEAPATTASAPRLTTSAGGAAAADEAAADEATVAAADGAPGDPRVGVPPVPDVPAPPRSTRAPGAVHVHVDRDGIAIPDGSRPQQRRLRLGGSLGLADIIETVGAPLPFTDKRGAWVVRHGTSADEGQVLAVVEQVDGIVEGDLGGASVHLLSDAAPADLLTAADELHLYYCSVPGTVEEVLTAAREGRTTPPAPPRAKPDNPQLREAIATFAAQPDRDRMLHVLRQALGGRLVLDATGSDVHKTDGGKPDMRLTTVTAPDGSRGIGAFTSNVALADFRRKLHEKAGTTPPAELVGLAQAGPTVLELFRQNEDLRWLILDPGGPSCALGKPEVNYALSAPSNTAVKDLLAREHSIQELFDALRAPDSQLFLAEKKRPETEDTEGGTPTAGPVFARHEADGSPVMVVFTSPAEVAAYGADFSSRRFPVEWLMRFFLRSRVKEMRINPSGPSATLSSFQVWHMLGTPPLEARPAATAQPEQG